MKWRLVSIIFCDKKVLPKLEGKTTQRYLRVIMLYRVESFSVKNSYVEKFGVAEIRMFSQELLHKSS